MSQVGISFSFTNKRIKVFSDSITFDDPSMLNRNATGPLLHYLRGVIAEVAPQLKPVSSMLEILLVPEAGDEIDVLPPNLLADNDNSDNEPHYICLLEITTCAHVPSALLKKSPR